MMKFQMGSSLQPLTRRIASFASIAGVGLVLGTLTPQRASALTLWYNTAQDADGVSALGTTGSLDGNANNYFVEGVISNLIPNSVEIILTSNFGNLGNFAGGTPPPGAVFNITGIASAPTLVGCTTSTISGTTPPADGVTCSTQTPLLTFFPSGDLQFIASDGWELALKLPPPQGGPDNFLSSAGESMRFVLIGIQEANFTPNTTQQGEGGTTATGTYSCVHAQGLTGATTSNRLCATLGTPPIPSSVPGPLPLLGAAAAFGYSRKIRTRIKASRQQEMIS
jgi:hypothetical protein